MKVNPELIQILEEILFEFETSKPEICLVPSKDENCAKDGGMIRVPTTVNPEWYKRMCSHFPPVNWKEYKPHRKNQRTIVKRQGIIEIIGSLIKNLESSSKYAPYILDEAQHRLELYQRVDELKPFKNQF